MIGDEASDQSFVHGIKVRCGAANAAVKSSPRYQPEAATFAVHSASAAPNTLFRYRCPSR
jgi:hypothetical protein